MCMYVVRLCGGGLSSAEDYTVDAAPCGPSAFNRYITLTAVLNKATGKTTRSLMLTIPRQIQGKVCS